MNPKIIQDAQMPLIDGAILQKSGKTSNPVTANSDAEVPAEVSDRDQPSNIIAQDVQSQSFNSSTRKFKGMFTFEQVGGIIIGEFESGVSGQIEITKDGITATDLDGNTTFSIDGATGGATFAGTVIAATIIAGTVITDAVVQDGTININNHFEVDASGNVKLKTLSSIGDVIFYDDGVTQANQVATINATDGLKMFTDKPITLRGTATPSAAPANGVSLYVDQSAGKNRLMARFPTGASQIVATEP